MKHLILILTIALSSICCSAQNNKETKVMKTTERIDLEYYKRKIKEHSNYEDATQAEYIERNGTQTYVSFNTDGYVLQEIRPYSYDMRIRNYYKNGILKCKGKLLCHSGVKIGLWREYDEQGNLVKETDEDKKFENLRLKPEDILSWLERKGYIDRRTGKGQERFVDKDPNDPDIGIYFTQTERKGVFSKHLLSGWAIEITNHGMRTSYYFNADTGEYQGKREQMLYE